MVEAVGVETAGVVVVVVVGPDDVDVVPDEAGVVLDVVGVVAAPGIAADEGHAIGMG